MQELIVPYFVNFNALGDKKILDKKLDYMIVKFEEKLKKHTNKSEDEDEEVVYDSKKFPSVNEMKGLINLIRVVKQNYVFIHPLDQRGSTISKKEFQTIE